MSTTSFREPLLVIAIFAFLAFLSACSRSDAAPEKTTAPAEAAPIVPVAKVGRADLASDLTLTAEFEPYQQIDVMAKVAGYVQLINVDIGDRVHKD
jgi:multidrug efflux pump subunit AcrA (membrane-fusion protein)